jgi:hypothetical protein
MIDMLRLLTGASLAPPAAPSPSPFDFIRLQAMIYEESRRIHDLLCERLLPRVATEADPGDAELSALLRRAQMLLFRHPVAAQAAFAALIAEGRRFAATPEGAAWADALAGSALVHEGRRVWDAVGMNMLEDDPATVIPSAYLEALFRAARSANLDGLIAGNPTPQPPPRSGEGEPEKPLRLPSPLRGGVGGGVSGGADPLEGWQGDEHAPPR